MENDNTEAKSQGEKSGEIHERVKGAAEKAARKLTKRVILLVVCVLVLLVCVFGAIGVGAYKLGWDNKFTNATLRVLPFPAAVMSNGHFISFYDWRYEVKALRQLNTKQSGSYDEATVEKDVMEKLINEQIVRDLARKFNVRVTQADLDQKLADLEKQIGTKAELVTKVNDFFGWDLATFEARVLQTDTLRTKLEAQLAADPVALSDVLAKAKAVLVDMSSGKITFEDAAKKYSADVTSGANGGELGWFPRGVMVKEFEDAAFGLEKGKISEPVKTQFGYHLIKLEDKKPADKTNGEQVQAKHILFAPKGLAEYIKEYKDKIKVYKFVAKDAK